MYITWSTEEELKDTPKVVLWKENREETTTFSGYSEELVLDGMVHYTHRVHLHKLEDNQRYRYQVGEEHSGIWSKVYSFRTRSQDSVQVGHYVSLRGNGSSKIISRYLLTQQSIIIYGDLGLINGVSLPQLQREAEQDKVDLIIHAGDIAVSFFYFIQVVYS